MLFSIWQLKTEWQRDPQRADRETTHHSVKKKTHPLNNLTPHLCFAHLQQKVITRIKFVYCYNLVSWFNFMDNNLAKELFCLSHENKPGVWSELQCYKKKNLQCYWSWTVILASVPFPSPASVYLFINIFIVIVLMRFLSWYFDFSKLKSKY